MKSELFEKLFVRYYVGAMGVGGAGMVIDTWDAKVARWVKGENGPERRKTEMLLGEKVGLFLWGTMMGPLMVPFKMTSALDRIDIWMKGKRIEDYGMTQKDCLLDYMFVWF